MSFLTEKMGPLPVWGWLAVLTVGAFLLMSKGKSKKAAAGAQQSQNAADTAAEQALATQAAAVTTVPYTTATSYGGNYGNGSSGGNRMSRNWNPSSTTPAVTPPVAATPAPVTPTPVSPVVSSTTTPTAPTTSPTTSPTTTPANPYAGAIGKNGQPVTTPPQPGFAYFNSPNGGVTQSVQVNPNTGLPIQNGYAGWTQVGPASFQNTNAEAPAFIGNATLPPNSIILPASDVSQYTA
jgi:hypothetical protein